MANLSEEFLGHWHAQQGASPNLLLGAHVSRIQEILVFIDAEPEAAKPRAEIERIFSTTNWLLDPGLFQKFAQVIGEVQFWAMARKCGVELKRISEQADDMTPDFRLAGVEGMAPCFEVKTLSVVDGIYNLEKIDEKSFEAQLSLSKQIAEGRAVATSIHEAAPHGVIRDGKNMTTIIRNLINKAGNNVKRGQFANAPTCLVLNLLLIDGYYNGNAALRPVAFGYPEAWQLRSGSYWNLAFGKPGNLVFGIAEFEGKPCVEGELDKEGILHTYPEIRALLLIVHDLQEGPKIYGLKREADEDQWLNELKALGEAFHKLVGENWNDDGDTMGCRLNEH